MPSQRPLEPAPLRFLPHLWQVPTSLGMALAFGAAWYGVTVLFAPVDMSCSRANGRVTCDVTTQQWPSPSALHLSEQALANAALVLVPQQYDHSYRQVELRKDAPSHAPPTLLVDFSQDIQEPAIEAINDYLDSPSREPIAKRIVAPTVNRLGLLTVQFMSFACIALMIVALMRRTSITSQAARLKVHRSRWPLEPVVHELELAQIADVAPVTRIPEGLAQVVATLPWRNLYRANALAVRLQTGEEVLITEWCKRGLSLHQRLAASINAWRAAESPNLR